MKRYKNTNNTFFPEAEPVYLILCEKAGTGTYSRFFELRNAKIHHQPGLKKQGTLHGHKDTFHPTGSG